MKAISMWQPWASLVVLGSKTIETRDWSTGYRGPLLIHAAKRIVKRELKELQEEPDFMAAFWKLGPHPNLFDLPFGHIVGRVDVVDCRKVEIFSENDLYGGQTFCEYDLGNFAPGRFGWVLANPVHFAKPIQWVGAQGFFNVDEKELAACKP